MAKMHGKRGTGAWKSWRNMRDRVLFPNCKSYPNYGGRGIKMCQRWLESFQAFYDDMGDRPSPHHSLDRIDVNGDYCKENCRWSTIQEQAWNKRSNIKLEGKVLAEWARENDIPYEYARRRAKRGLSPKQIIAERKSYESHKNKAPK